LPSETHDSSVATTNTSDPLLLHSSLLLVTSLHHRYQTLGSAEWVWLRLSLGPTLTCLHHTDPRDNGTCVDSVGSLAFMVYVSGLACVRTCPTIRVHLCVPSFVFTAVLVQVSVC
jgi:hypothetical protein